MIETIKVFQYEWAIDDARRLLNLNYDTHTFSGKAHFMGIYPVNRTTGQKLRLEGEWNTAYVHTIARDKDTTARDVMLEEIRRQLRLHDETPTDPRSLAELRAAVREKAIIGYMGEERSSCSSGLAAVLKTLGLEPLYFDEEAAKREFLHAVYEEARNRVAAGSISEREANTALERAGLPPLKVKRVKANITVTLPEGRTLEEGVIEEALYGIADTTLPISIDTEEVT